ncbi:MAG TPA: phosphoesterase, partial [Armatimonadota bacterium]|nr:phosphoesterase [Armatimonadota bacterium]
MNPHFSSLLRRLVLASLGLLLIQSARPAAAESVVTHWNEATLQAVRETRPGPPMVARALAIVHTCAYDAWAAYDKKAVGTRFGAEARRRAAERTAANKEKAVSFAAYRALVDLFPQPDQVAAFSAHMRQLGYDPDDASTDPTTPAGIGNRCANAVLTFRHADGSNQLGDLHPGRYSDYTGYVAVNDPDRVNDPSRWQP